MKYSSSMQLGYISSATSIETVVELVHPETGESNKVGFDNLTNAMYFIVCNNLLPLREGLSDPINLDSYNIDVAEIQATFDKAGITDITPEQAVDDWRKYIGVGKTLFIQCEGDPELIQEQIGL